MTQPTSSHERWTETHQGLRESGRAERTWRSLGSLGFDGKTWDAADWIDYNTAGGELRQVVRYRFVPSAGHGPEVTEELSHSPWSEVFAKAASRAGGFAVLVVLLAPKSVFCIIHENLGAGLIKSPSQLNNMRCPKCSFDPRELDIFKMLHLPDDYPERVRWQKNAEHRKTLEFYAWFISGYEQARILDLGAGPGTVAVPLARLENVTDVVCFERDEGARKTVEAIKGSEGIEKIHVTGEGEPWNLPFGSQSFDAVICRYAMHHFQDQAGTVREISRCLKVSGLFLYSDPAMPEHSRNTTHGLYLLREKSFFGYSTYHEMIEHVSTAGLEILAVRPYDYQRGTLEDYLKDSEPGVKEHLVRAWRGLDERTKRELKWSGEEAGPFITYPILDIAARKPI